MKKLIYLLAIALFAIMAQSCDPKPNLDQKTFVSGIVTDAATGEPIKGCEVYLSRHISTRMSPIEPSVTTTNESGYYEFTHVYFGTYNIDAIADGYKPYTVENLILADEHNPAEVNISLEKVE